MSIDFYYTDMSGPCRAVLLTAKLINVELNLKNMNLGNGDHKTPEFLKINPQHQVPVLVDNGLAICESRAIMTYLVNKYAKGNPLYPEEPEARAMVDQRLYFDVSTLNQKFSEYAYPQYFEGAPADEKKLLVVEEVLGFLNTFLERTKFVAGDHVTLADLSIAVTVANFSIIGVDIYKYPKIKSWFEAFKTAVPIFEEVNEPGRKAWEQLTKYLMNSRK